jgi:hypothetical protein
VALAKVAHERLYETGDAYLTLTEIEEIAQQHGMPEASARHVLRSLDDEGLLVTADGHLYEGDIRLAILYEDRYDRPALWRANELRREILKRAAEAFERGEREVDYQEGGARMMLEASSPRAIISTASATGPTRSASTTLPWKAASNIG